MAEPATGAKEPALGRRDLTCGVNRAGDAGVAGSDREVTVSAVEHIAGARNLPLDKMVRLWNTLPKNRLLVLYESGRKPGDICAAGRAAGRILLAHSFSRDQVKVFQEGLAAWEKAGLPVEGHRQASLR